MNIKTTLKSTLLSIIFFGSTATSLNSTADYSQAALVVSNIAMNMLKKDADPTASLVLENIRLTKQILLQIAKVNDGIAAILLEMKKDKEEIINAVVTADFNSYIRGINGAKIGYEEFVRAVKYKEDSGEQNIDPTKMFDYEALKTDRDNLSSFRKNLMSAGEADPLIAIAIIGTRRFEVAMLRELGGGWNSERSLLDSYGEYFENTLLSADNPKSLRAKYIAKSEEYAELVKEIEATQAHQFLNRHNLENKLMVDVPFYCFYVSAGVAQQAYFYRWITIDRTPSKHVFDDEDVLIDRNKVISRKEDGPYWILSAKSPPPVDGSGGFPKFFSLERESLTQTLEHYPNGKPTLTDYCISVNLDKSKYGLLYVQPIALGNGRGNMPLAPYAVMIAEIDRQVDEISKRLIVTGSDRRGQYWDLIKRSDWRKSLTSTWEKQKEWLSTWDGNSKTHWVGLPQLKPVEEDYRKWVDLNNRLFALANDIETYRQALELSKLALSSNKKYIDAITK